MSGRDDFQDRVLAALQASGSFSDSPAPALPVSTPPSVEVTQETPAPQEMTSQEVPDETKTADGKSIPYSRFREKAQENKALKRLLAEQEAELSQFRTGKKADTNQETPEGETDSWLDEIFSGKKEKGEQRKGETRPSPSDTSAVESDPVLSAMRDEYAQKQLDKVLEAHKDLPEDFVLRALVSGVPATQLKSAYEETSRLLGVKTQEAKPQPPPRPGSSSTTTSAPTPPKPQLPENQYDRVEFLANWINQRGK